MGKEIRTVKMIFNKDGHGSLSTRISIPKSWADKLGFSQEKREAEIVFDDEKECIVIKKTKRD
ncbi:hypothetical protein FNSP4_09890 [Fusobacterium nucleatum]|nr:hypothetical protein FNCP4_03940 [Fusobacterium nucleatum]BEP03255.1 hypothetical protein FNSP4_09890 [Fusobacterium nucleatum]